MKNFNKIILKVKKYLWYKHNSRINFWILYSLVFVFLSFFVFSSFIFNGKSFIWTVDGINQHYPALVYLGQYLREFIKNILHGDFQLPMWDLSIGLGADVLTSLNYYSFGDPVDLFSIFFRSSKMEYCYNFLVILRLYLAGFAFCKFCFEIKKNRYQTLIGSISYIFCGYALIAIRHPFFINPMIYLPLVLIGVERIFKKKSSKFFIFSIAVTAISNFYFLYMITIMAFIYALIKYSFQKYRTIKEFFKLLGKFIAVYLLGIGLSAVIFFPVCLAFLSNPRGAVTGDFNLLFYDKSYYMNIITNIFKADTFGYWSIIGISSVSILCIILLFCRKVTTDRQKKLRFAFVIFTVFLMIPFFGFVFNGFSYITNRWVFSYAFLLSLITVEMIPSLLHLEAREKKLIQIIVTLLALFTIIFEYNRDKESMRGCIILLITTAIIFYMNINMRQKKLFILALTGVSVISMSFGSYSIAGNNRVSEYMDRGASYENIINSPQSAILKLNDKSIYRIQDKEMKKGNFSLVMNTNTTTNFFSLTGDNITDYSLDLANPRLEAAFRLVGFENRAPLLTLAAVKYIVLDEKASQREVPYGFEPIKKYKANKIFGGKTKGYIYKNKYNLPIGYVYDKVFLQNEYMKLDYSDREQVQTGAAIVTSNNTSLPKYNVKNNQKILLKKDKIIEKISENPNIEYKNNKLYISKSGISCSIQIPEQIGKELYFEICGMKYEDKNFIKKNISKNQTLSNLEKNQIQIQHRFWKPSTETTIGLQVEDYQTDVRLRTKNNDYFFNQSDYLFDIGEGTEKKLSIILDFQKAGVYSFDEIKVFSNDFVQYKKNIQSLQKNKLYKISIDNNMIKGKVNSKNKGILCIAIPYNKGWKATVDGKQKNIKEINSMYMGVDISKGKHDIVLKYETPGLKKGGIISMASFILSMLLFVFERRRQIY